MLSNPEICRYLAPPLFPAVHAGLTGGIRLRPLPRSRSLSFAIRGRHTTAAVPFRSGSTGPTEVINSLVLNGVSDGSCLPEDSVFWQLPIRSLSGWVSLLFVYAVGVHFRGCRHVLDESVGYYREQ